MQTREEFIRTDPAIQRYIEYEATPSKEQIRLVKQFYPITKVRTKWQTRIILIRMAQESINKFDEEQEKQRIENEKQVEEKEEKEGDIDVFKFLAGNYGTNKWKKVNAIVGIFKFTVFTRQLSYGMLPGFMEIGELSRENQNTMFQNILKQKREKLVDENGEKYVKSTFLATGINMAGKDIKAFVESVVRGFYNNRGYIYDFFIQIPLDIKEAPAGTPIMKLPLRNSPQAIDRTEQGLINVSKDLPGAFCCVDLVYEHIKNYKRRIGNKYINWSRDDVIGLFCQLYPNDSADVCLERGFTAEDIVEVCRRIRIKGVIVWHGAQLSRSQSFNTPLVDETIISDNSESKKTIPLLSFCVVDGHVYKKELALKQGVDRNSNKVGIADVISSDSFVIVDSMADVVTGNYQTVYIRSPTNELNTVIRQLMVDLKKTFNIITLDGANEITCAMIDNRIYKWTPDIDRTLKLLAHMKEKNPNLNIAFEGASYQSVILKYGQTFHKLYASIMSWDTWRVFTSFYGRSYPQIGLVKKGYDLKDCVNIDKRKCYQSTGNNTIIPIVTANMEFENWNGEKIIDYHWYYVEAPQYVDSFLFSGPGVYPGSMVAIGLADSLICKSNIIKVLKCKSSGQTFKPLFDDINTIDDNANLPINMFIGTLNKASSVSSISQLYSTDLNYIVSYYNGLIEGLDDTDADRVHYTIDTLDLGDKLTLYSFRSSLQLPNLENYLIHHSLIVTSSQLEMYIKLKEIAEYNNTTPKDIMVAVYVDTLCLRPGTILSPSVKDTKELAQPGDMVKCGPPKKNLTTNCRERLVRDPYYPDPDYTWRRENSHVFIADLPAPLEFDYSLPITKLPENTPISELCNGKSLGICCKGGRGKSWIISKILEFLTAANINTVVLAPTHSAVDNINGFIGSDVAKTVCSFLGINESKTETKGLVCRWTKAVKVIIIDECFLLCDKFWAIILKYRIKYNTVLILSGDDGQILPIKSLDGRCLNPYGSLFHKLAGNGRMLDLKTNWRLMKSLNDKTLTDEEKEEIRIFEAELDKTHAGGELDLSLFKYDLKLENKLSICATNGLMDRINYIQAYKNSTNRDYNHPLVDYHIYVGMPLIACETIDETIKNGQKFTIVSFTADKITLERKGVQLIIDIKLLNKNFKQFFAITADRAQCSTYDFDFTVFQLDKPHFLMERHGVVYTIISRATKLSHIYLGDADKVISIFDKLESQLTLKLKK